MNILIANVGNIRSNEIKALAEALNKKHKVTIVSMAMESSHRGQAFSFRDTPVRVTPLLYKDVMASASWVGQKDITSIKTESEKKLSIYDNIAAYEFHNNPADAIAVMLSEIAAHKLPDLVICGIGNGLAMGQDIYCSSNIGMAMESCFYGVPTIAVQVEHRVGGHTTAELKHAVQFIEKNIEAFADLNLGKRTFLNINIPTVEKYTQFKGVKVARMSRMNQLSTFIQGTDANGEKYFWANNVERINKDTGEEYARTWFDRKYITIVPMSYDATDHDAIKTWNDKHIKVLKISGEVMN